MNGAGDSLRERLGPELNEEFLAGLRVDLAVAREIGDLRAAERVVEEQHAGDGSHEGVLRVVERSHVEGNAALQVAHVLRRLQMLAVQKHAQLHGVPQAVRLLVQSLEDHGEVRPLVDAALLRQPMKLLGFHAHRKLATDVLAVRVHHHDVALAGSHRLHVDPVAVRVGLAIRSAPALGVAVRQKRVLSALYVLGEEKPDRDLAWTPRSASTV